MWCTRKAAIALDYRRGFSAGGFPEQSWPSVTPSIFMLDSAISGLIARRHGISLRPCVDYLKLRYKSRTERGGPVYARALAKAHAFSRLSGTGAEQQSGGKLHAPGGVGRRPDI
jgi:hypothetical protein